MAFSRITITFNEDLAEDKILSLSISSPTSFITKKWVITRTSYNEVEIGTPTANIGERSAINYTDIFNTEEDLTIFDIVQSVNEVVITFKNETQTFISGSSTGNVSFLIDSIALPPTDIYYDRINCRSPYFIKAPIDTGSIIVSPLDAVFELYVWSGDVVTDKPIDPNYTYKKLQRFSGDNILYLDISQQIKDYINHVYDGSFSVSCLFVSWKITTNYIGGSLIENNTLLAFDGYNSHFQGLNYNPTKDLLIDNTYISIKKGEVLTLPFFVGGTDDYSVTFRLDTTEVTTDSVTRINIFNTNSAVSFITEGADGFNNICITNDTTLEETIIDVEIVEECIYNPIKATFINKNGIQQDFWFFKSNKIDQNADYKTYKRNIINESIEGGVPTLSYDTAAHKKVKFNVNSNKNITLNTGYINEDNNIIIEQMLLSQYIWLDIDSNIVPVILTDKRVTYLTKRNEQLIKYTLKFEYSFNDIQNIR